MTPPRIIHQQWASDRVPGRFRSWVESWQRHHPGWKHQLWTDFTCADFVRTSYPDYFPLYNLYDEDIKRIDAFRYFLMHRVGGVYVDLDFECLRSIEPLLDPGTVVLGNEPELHATKLYRRASLVGNAIIASPPGHRFWEHVFTLLAERRHLDVLDATGPRMLQHAVETYPHDDLKVMSSETFYPLVAHVNSDLGLEAGEKSRIEAMVRTSAYPAASYAVHHWAGTWFRGDLATRTRRFVVRLRSWLGIGRY